MLTLVEWRPRSGLSTPRTDERSPQGMSNSGRLLRLPTKRVVHQSPFQTLSAAIYLGSRTVSTLNERLVWVLRALIGWRTEGASESRGRPHNKTANNHSHNRCSRSFSLTLRYLLCGGGFPRPELEREEFLCEPQHGAGGGDRFAP